MFATLLSAAALSHQVFVAATDPSHSAALMERVTRGDQAAFAEVVRTHQDDVARFCARFVGNVSIAAELTQEVFITLWNQRERYSESGRLRHYLLRIARHRCLALTKKRSSRRRLLERWQLPEMTLGGQPSEARHIDRALGRLKPAQRDLVILRYLEELELSEIAAITELKLGTVKSRLSRALAALRAELADD